jgi:nucleoside-diphosphate-sugar epimerase
VEEVEEVKLKSEQVVKVQGRQVFITGGTGYVGRRLAESLIARGHSVRVLARATSVMRVPAGADAVVGNALDATTFVAALRPEDTIVHLVGTPHPSPEKAAEFQRVDLPSIEAAVGAASTARVSHLIYVSVAHPAPVMREYIAVRMAGERSIAQAGLTATVLRPWYVLGPGHWWPVILMPVYAVMGLLPSTREGARRLGLVTIVQMVRALVWAVETPPASGTVRVLNVPDIRRGW